MKAYYQTPNAEGYFWTIIKKSRFDTNRTSYLEACKKMHHLHHTFVYEEFLKVAEELDYEDDFLLDYLYSNPLKMEISTAINDKKMIDLILNELSLDPRDCKNLELYYSEGFQEVGLFEDNKFLYFYCIDLWT